MDKIYIYALCDPRTNEVRYVGKTKNLKSRYGKHLRDKGKSYKNNWIKSLKSENLKPSFCVLNICTEIDWKIKEQYWIGMFPNLTNSSSGGEETCSKILMNNNHKFKLNNNNVTKIIELYKYTNLSTYELSILYKVTPATIHNVINGKQWLEITKGKTISLFNKQKSKRQILENKGVFTPKLSEKR